MKKEEKQYFAPDDPTYLLYKIQHNMYTVRKLAEKDDEFRKLITNWREKRISTEEMKDKVKKWGKKIYQNFGEEHESI